MRFSTQLRVLVRELMQFQRNRRCLQGIDRGFDAIDDVRNDIDLAQTTVRPVSRQ